MKTSRKFVDIILQLNDYYYKMQIALNIKRFNLYYSLLVLFMVTTNRSVANDEQCLLLNIMLLLRFFSVQ